MTAITMNDALERAGAGAYQRRLMGIFGLVWAADAMQVLAVGFTAASIAATFGLTVPQALQTGTAFRAAGGSLRASPCADRHRGLRCAVRRAFGVRA
jgi:hypothetical protein